MKIDIYNYPPDINPYNQGRQLLRITINGEIHNFVQDELHHRPERASFSNDLRTPEYYLEAMKLSHQAGKSGDEIEIEFHEMTPLN